MHPMPESTDMQSKVNEFLARGLAFPRAPKLKMFCFPFSPVTATLNFVYKKRKALGVVCDY